jgi:hypothetical protein
VPLKVEDAGTVLFMYAGCPESIPGVVILGDSGRLYIPENLPLEYGLQGLHVWFSGVVISDSVGIAMCGLHIKIIEIRPIREPIPGPEGPGEIDGSVELIDPPEVPVRVAP